MTETPPPLIIIQTIKFGNVSLARCPDGLYRDVYGTVFAYRTDGKLSNEDPDPRCGIYPAVIPLRLTSDTLAVACRVHDYLYESDAYQAFHPRSEGDNVFVSLEAQDTNTFWRNARDSMHGLIRWFGGKAWENDKTNN